MPQSISHNAKCAVFSEHEARLALVDDKIHETKSDLKGLQVRLNDVEARQDPLETSVHLLRADLTVIERETTGATQQISSLELATESLKCDAEQLGDRVEILENDPRIPELMLLEPRLNEFQNGVEDSMGDFDDRLSSLLKEVLSFLLSTATHLTNERSISTIFGDQS